MARAPAAELGREPDSLQLTARIAPTVYSLLRTTRSLSLGPGFVVGLLVVVERVTVGTGCWVVRVAVGRVVAPLVG